jgi:cytochrome c
METFMKFAAIGASVAALIALGAGGASAQDVAKGEQVFKKCATCHSIEPGAKKIGPSLHGVVGRPAGTLEGFNYSEAMKTSGKVWDDATLDAYLADPKGYIPKNKMAFVGLKEAKDRQDVIAYLKSVSPPAAPAAAPAPAQ